jgi:hypothetical protein
VPNEAALTAIVVSAAVAAAETVAAETVAAETAAVVVHLWYTLLLAAAQVAAVAAFDVLNYLLQQWL